MKLNITNDVTSADLEQLRKNLISYNVPHFEPVDEKPLGIFYDDDAGVRRAGLTGKLFGNWLLIEQNANMALKTADWAYVMQTGTILMQGEGKELLENEEVKAAYLGKAK